MAADTGNVVGGVAPGTAKKAHLEILIPENPDRAPIPLCFNPTDLRFTKQTTFAEVPIPGLTSPPIQFVRGASEKLAFDAVVDTSDDMTDVRKRYVNELRQLLYVDTTIHAPPVVKFVWGEIEFTGVLESLGVTYTLFADDGTPVRAKLAIALKEYATIEDQPRTPDKYESPDVEKAYVAQRTDTLSAIAQQAYGDPAPWREIARRNQITDPRSLPPGTVLTIPRLTKEPA